MAYIEIKNLTYFYPETLNPALDGINLTLEEGEYVLVAGGSGSGKSSLARALAGLIPEFYGGRIGGSISLAGEDVWQMPRREKAQRIGFVFQDPESQVVMTNVEQELAFGLENMGLPLNLMKRRIMEVATALSLHPYLKSSVHQLSGGLKQKVVLASILVMQPDILLLDEPTSQLDPVAGEEILTILRRLNEDNGLTVILIEQRLERCFHLADRFLFLDKGRISQNSTDRKEIAQWAKETKSLFLPPVARVFAAAGFEHIPFSVKEGRRMITPLFDKKEGNAKKADEIDQVDKKASSPLLEAKKVWYTYQDGTEALKGVDLEIYPGDFVAVLGENAAGKTTLLKNLRGLLQPQKGKIRFQGRDMKEFKIGDLAACIGYLSQNPNDYLFMPTVAAELRFTQKNLGIEDENSIEKLLGLLELLPYAEINPRDLSAGERQRVALASVLAAKPRLLLLDEPTRGLDFQLKANLSRILLALQKEGLALVVVTHDVEFAAELSRDIILMTQGQIIARGKKTVLLSRSAFYSPQVNKLFRGIEDSLVTIKEGQAALQRLKQQKGV